MFSENLFSTLLSASKPAHSVFSPSLLDMKHSELRVLNTFNATSITASYLAKLI